MSKQVIIEVLAGPEVGQRLEFDQDKILVGRGSQCALRVASPHVSRQQCELSVHGDQLVLENLGSVNATYLNDRPIDRVYIQDGDLITFCDVALRVRLPRPVNFKDDADRTVAYPAGQAPPGLHPSAGAQSTLPPAGAPTGPPSPRPPTQPPPAPAGVGLGTGVGPALRRPPQPAGPGPGAPPRVPGPPPQPSPAPPQRPAAAAGPPPGIPGPSRGPQPGMPGRPSGPPGQGAGLGGMPPRMPGAPPGPPPGMPGSAPQGPGSRSQRLAPPGSASVSNQRRRKRRKPKGGKQELNLPLIRNVVVALAVVMVLLMITHLILERSEQTGATASGTGTLEEQPKAAPTPNTQRRDRTDQEIIQDAEDKFGTASTYLLQYRVADENLSTAIDNFRKAQSELALVPEALWPDWAFQVDEQIAQAEDLLNTQFSRVKLDYVRAYQAEDYADATAQCERMRRLVPDPKDERHIYAKDKIRRLRAMMSGDKKYRWSDR